MQRNYTITFIILIITVLDVQCQTKNQKQKFINEQIIQHAYQQWEKITNLTTFERTIQAFPQLKENIQIKKTIQLLEKGGCSNLWGDEPAQFIIIDNQIFSYGLNKDYSRTRQYKAHLKKISKKVRFPDMYFILDYLDAIFPQLLGQDHLEQCKKIPAFVFNKNYSDEYSRSKFLLPDTYIIQPKWQDLINQIKNSSQQYQWNKKIPKLFFRGIPSGPHKFRFKMDSSVNFSKYFHRAALVQLGLSHPDLIDAYFSKDPGPLSDELQKRVGKQTKIFTYKVASFSEHIKFKYLFSADGRGTAWKRLAFILFSNSLLVKPFSQQIQWFYDKIIPFTHFLQIKDDLSDLFERLQDVRKNEWKALEMIKNANDVANKYLTPEAISNYTFETLVKYAKIQNLRLTQEQKLDIKNGIDAQLVLKLKIIKEEWESFPKIISFQQTINAFPFLKQNLNIFKIKELIQKGGCGIQYVIFFIIENIVYCQGQFCKQNTSKNLKKIFQRISTKTTLPDMLFIVAINDTNLWASKVPKEFYNICRSIPFFVFQKNVSCPIEQTKFLLPNPQNLINQTNFQMNSWQQKINKLYLQWTLPDNIFTQTQENFVDYINQNKFLKLFKKYSDIVQAKIITNKQIKNDKLNKTLLKKFFKNIVGFQQTPHVTKLNYKYIFVSDKSSQNIVPYILNSSSIIFMPFYSSRFQWFYQKMIPGVHFISLRQDFSDLIRTFVLISKNIDIAKRMTRQIQFFAKNQLTLESIDNYVIDVLFKYSQIQNLKVTQQLKQLIKLGNIFQVLRVQKNQIIWNNLEIINAVLWVTIMMLVLIAIIKIANNQQKLIKKNIFSKIGQEHQEMTFVEKD